MLKKHDIITDKNEYKCNTRTRRSNDDQTLVVQFPVDSNEVVDNSIAFVNYNRLHSCQCKKQIILHVLGIHV